MKSESISSFRARKSRIDNMCDSWGLKRLAPLVASWEVPKPLWADLRNAVAAYISKALESDLEAAETVRVLEEFKSNTRNVTPNGAIVPKREYSALYNWVLACWIEVLRAMTFDAPSLLSRVRVTPNIRVKFASEFASNEGRPLNTAIPHSDAWVEGPWGMNCFVPIFGDTLNNTLTYWRIDDENFRDEFLSSSPSYFENQWVLDHLKPDLSISTPPGYVYLSDFAVIHATTRKPGCGPRVSIDTTLMVGDYPVHPDREVEYRSSMPNFGVDTLVICERSQDQIAEKQTTFSHYTSGNIRWCDLSSN